MYPGTCASDTLSLFFERWSARLPFLIMLFSSIYLHQLSPGSPNSTVPTYGWESRRRMRGYYRYQFATPLPVRIFFHLVALNILGFLVAFALLSTMAAPGASSSQEVPQARPQDSQAAAARISWTKTIVITDKTRALPALFVTENGTHRQFVITEWTTWKHRAAVWFQEIGIPGFFAFAEDLFKLRSDNTFEPIPGCNESIEEIQTSVRMQRSVLMSLASNVLNIQDLPSANEIARCEGAEITYQFKGLAGILYKILAALVACSTPNKDTGVSIYAEIFNATTGPLVLKFGVHNPLAPLMIIVMLNAKFMADPAGTTKDMEDALQLWITTVSSGQDAGLSLSNMCDFISTIHDQYWAIANRDSKGVYTLNRNIQEGVCKAIQIACINTVRTTQSADMVISADGFRNAVAALGVAKEDTFSKFYTKLVQLCTTHIPATTSAPKTPLPTIDAVVAGAKTATKPSLAMVAAPLPHQPTERTCRPCCTQVVHDAIKTYGFNAVQGILQKSASSAAHWMCENCCRLGHKSFDCTYPTDPDREQKLKAHREARVTHRRLSKTRQAVRAQGARQASSSANNAQGNNHCPGNNNPNGGASCDNQRGHSNPAGSLQISLPASTGSQGGQSRPRTSVHQRITGGPSEAQLDEALAAFRSHSSSGLSGSRFQELDDDYDPSAYLTTTTCVATEPQRIGMPLFLLLAITGLLASQVAAPADNISVGLCTVIMALAFCVYYTAFFVVIPDLTPLKHHASAPYRPARFTWFKTGVITTLLALAIFVHLFAGADAATNQSAYMTDAQRRLLVLVDTGCTRTMFCSAARFINVRPLSPPVDIGGAVPGSVRADQIGDFPLFLEDEHGQLHLRIIKDCMVSSSAQANLLSHNDLRKARVGILVPDNETDPAVLYWGRGTTKSYTNLPLKHGLIPLPSFR